MNIDTNGSVLDTFESKRSALTGIGLMMWLGIWIICYRLFDLRIINKYQYEVDSDGQCVPHFYVHIYELDILKGRGQKKSTVSTYIDSFWDCWRDLKRFNCVLSGDYTGDKTWAWYKYSVHNFLYYCNSGLAAPPAPILIGLLNFKLHLKIRLSNGCWVQALEWKGERK